mmetsp:Transcript_10/g.7  ORF Transcript_10/g.7 Transcript_10/m.7 type:complete len:90 (-) Transcript_10:168-437(-)
MLFFHFIYKAFPFELNAGEDPAARTTDFIFTFESSERNRQQAKTSMAFKKMLEKMMRYNPDDRVTLEEILNSDWIKECTHTLQHNSQAQ